MKLEQNHLGNRNVDSVLYSLETEKKELFLLVHLQICAMYIVWLVYVNGSNFRRTVLYLKNQLTGFVPNDKM